MDLKLLPSLEANIPLGDYCYTLIGIDSNIGFRQVSVCPFWRKFADKPEQLNGYCTYLKLGDWMEDGTLLLWDQVKECGINHDLTEYLAQPIASI
jgi:hypothetical protein